MTNQKILISAVLVIILGVAGFSVYKSKNSLTDWPPDVIIKEGTRGYIVGHVTIGPNCPVERVDEPCKTPPEAYSSRVVILYESDGNTIKWKGKIDAEGNYKFSPEPGNYYLQIEPAGIRSGEKKFVTVKAKETATVNFDIDTGIR